MGEIYCPKYLKINQFLKISKLLTFAAIIEIIYERYF